MKRDLKRNTKGKADVVDAHVGERLRIRRSLLGISQDKLADAIGLTFQQIQKYERGFNRISAGRLYRFSKILNVDVQYFYDGYEGAEPNKLSDDLPNDVLSKKETITLVRNYYALPEDMRPSMINFITNLSKGNCNA